MQGLGIRMAKALNRAMRAEGSVFADRYHGHVLRTPSEVKRALDYVRDNEEKHFGRPGHAFSSLAYPDLVAQPRTWLLSRGWARAG
jgi:hypothetical protein